MRRVLKSLGVDDGLGFVDQFFQRFELAVDAGKSHISHLIDASQPLGHGFADGGAGRFAIVLAENLFLYFVDNPPKFAFRHRPFETGAFEAGINLVSIPRQAPAVAFDDGEFLGFLDALVGGKALPAIQAFPPPTNGRSAFAGARIDHLQALFVGITEWAMHEPVETTGNRGEYQRFLRPGNREAAKAAKKIAKEENEGIRLCKHQLLRGFLRDLRAFAVLFSYELAMPLQVLMNTGGLAMTNCFVVADTDAKQAVMFDAPDNTTLPLIEQCKARGWDLIGLWLTHGHFDHIADHAVVTSHFPAAKVLIHKLDEPKLKSPGVQTRMFQLPFTIPPRSADGFLEENQAISIGSLNGKVLFTPGHSPGHVSIYFEKEQLLVGGDLIIGGSVGRTDLPDSVHADLERSIRAVMKLPPATRLLPGHGDVSTLAEELESNFVVREILSRAE